MDEGQWISQRVSLYEFVRAQHVPLRAVMALGLDVEDLGAPVGTAARRAGVSADRLTAPFDAGAVVAAGTAREGAFATGS